MVSVDSLFGNYLKSGDFQEEQQVEIQAVSVEQFGREDDSERKAIVFFRGLQKGLVLNKINAETLKEIAGTPELDDWMGVKCIIYTDPNVQFSGKRVGGLRIKPLPKGKEKKA